MDTSPFCLYRNPLTSDLSRPYPSLDIVLGQEPTPGARIVQDGIVMAYCRDRDPRTVIDAVIWTLTAAGQAQ